MAILLFYQRFSELGKPHRELGRAWRALLMAATNYNHEQDEN
jgi:hypothetical protein